MARAARAGGVALALLVLACSPCSQPAGARQARAGLLGRVRSGGGGGGSGGGGGGVAALYSGVQLYLGSHSRQRRERGWGGHDSAGVWCSQVGQDHGIVSLFTGTPGQGPHGRYFVDLGSNHWLMLSNTRALERDYRWRGLCIEGMEKLLFRLAMRRTCTVVGAVVGRQTGEVVQYQSRLTSGRSGIIANTTDNKPGAHPGAEQYRHEVVALADVLEAQGAPQTIDYLSLDVEGAEDIVLGDFPFTRYTFLAMTIERPKESLREKLRKEGYIYVHSRLFGDELWLHRSFPGGVAPAAERANTSVAQWQSVQQAQGTTLVWGKSNTCEQDDSDLPLHSKCFQDD